MISPDLITFARVMIEMEEGRRSRAYDDATGALVRSPKGKLTIGVGHNIQDVPLSDRVIDLIFDEDLERTWGYFEDIFPTYPSWKHGRILAAFNMLYAMGLAGFLRFERLIAAIRILDWSVAALETLDSSWAKSQAPARAKRVSEMFRTGEHPYKDIKHAK